MHISAIATDFDGTISKGDDLDPRALDAIRRWRARGHAAILVSGRSFEFLHDLQQREQTFDLIVAENGAVLYNPTNDEMSLPFGEAPSDLVNTLIELGVPMWRGTAIAGTHLPYDDAIWVAGRELGLTAHVETNRNEVMLLPPGADKGAGLLSLLGSERLSPRNLLAFGDAENDLSLLKAVEVKVAVANAVDSLKDIADYVTPEEGPAGVSAFIERYLLDEQSFDFPIDSAHHFDLDSAGQIHLNAYDLVDRNLLITGGSGYGKSWLASHLAHGLIAGGYQVLGLDPVGGLKSLKRQTTCLCLGQDETPPISLIEQMLEETNLSLVVNLTQIPTVEERVFYVAGLLRRVLQTRQRYGKPHWLIVDEAQNLLGGRDNPATAALLQTSGATGVCMATWQPSRLNKALLERVNGMLLTKQYLDREVACVRDLLAERGVDVPDLHHTLRELGEGKTLVWGLSSDDQVRPVRLNVGPRSFPDMKRLHRYLEEKVRPSRRFYFHNAKWKVSPAGNLSDLIDRMHILPVALIEFHFQRHDFTRWIQNVLRDETLVRWLERLHTTDLSGEDLRAAILEALEQRHRVLERVL